MKCDRCGGDVLPFLWVDDFPGGHYVLAESPLTVRLEGSDDVSFITNTVRVVASQRVKRMLCRDLDGPRVVTVADKEQFDREVSPVGTLLDDGDAAPQVTRVADKMQVTREAVGLPTSADLDRAHHDVIADSSILRERITSPAAPQTGLDRAREAVARARGGYAPDRPVTLCGTFDPSKPYWIGDRKIEPTPPPRRATWWGYLWRRLFEWR